MFESLVAGIKNYVLKGQALNTGINLMTSALYKTPASQYNWARDFKKDEVITYQDQEILYSDDIWVSTDNLEDNVKLNCCCYQIKGEPLKHVILHIYNQPGYEAHAATLRDEVVTYPDALVAAVNLPLIGQSDGLPFYERNLVKAIEAVINYFNKEHYQSIVLVGRDVPAVLAILAVYQNQETPLGKKLRVLAIDPAETLSQYFGRNSWWPQSWRAYYYTNFLFGDLDASAYNELPNDCKNSIITTGNNAEPWRIFNANGEFNHTESNQPLKTLSNLFADTSKNPPPAYPPSYLSSIREWCENMLVSSRTLYPFNQDYKTEGAKLIGKTRVSDNHFVTLTDGSISNYCMVEPADKDPSLDTVYMIKVQSMSDTYPQKIPAYVETVEYYNAKYVERVVVIGTNPPGVWLNKPSAKPVYSQDELAAIITATVKDCLAKRPGKVIVHGASMGGSYAALAVTALQAQGVDVAYFGSITFKSMTDIMVKQIINKLAAAVLLAPIAGMSMLFTLSIWLIAKLVGTNLPTVIMPSVIIPAVIISWIGLSALGAVNPQIPQRILSLFIYQLLKFLKFDLTTIEAWNKMLPDTKYCENNVNDPMVQFESSLALSVREQLPSASKTHASFFYYHDPEFPQNPVKSRLGAHSIDFKHCTVYENGHDTGEPAQPVVDNALERLVNLTPRPK
ncbi:MAG: hypothetical protein Tsb005_01530 [Gammaproteobacteria bacterium]